MYRVSGSIDLALKPEFHTQRERVRRTVIDRLNLDIWGQMKNYFKNGRMGSGLAIKQYVLLQDLIPTFVYQGVRLHDFEVV